MNLLRYAENNYGLYHSELIGRYCDPVTQPTISNVDRALLTERHDRHELAGSL
jgi:hypothetical protein